MGIHSYRAAGTETSQSLLSSLAEMLVAYLERHLGEHQRRSLEIELRQSQKMEALGTLAGGIAHDVNNLLAVITSNAELGRTDLPADHPASISLGEIAKTCERAKDIVRQILLFSRRSETERAALNLQPAAEDALKFLRAAVSPNIEIRATFHSNLPRVCADASQIYQVIINLGINSAHAMSASGGVLSVDMDGITIKVDDRPPMADLKPGAYVRLSVEDTGAGMSPQIMEHLFEPFFTTKGLAGTGLGLSIVHRIVRDHGGTIAVDSTMGRGTIFKVYLPATPPPVVKPPTKTLNTVAGGGEHILYVDDEEVLASVMERAIKRLGYRCTTYSDATAALLAFRASPHKFDAVITDMLMPEMSGTDLAKELLEIRPDLPVALTSGFWDGEINNAAGLRIAATIPKPATMAELSHALCGIFLRA